MAEQKRLGAMAEVADMYQTLMAAEEKRVRATVISARKATVEQKKKIMCCLKC
jgi:F-type H+-transporting ATPase subunit delta